MTHLITNVHEKSIAIIFDLNSVRTSSPKTKPNFPYLISSLLKTNPSVTSYLTHTYDYSSRDSYTTGLKMTTPVFEKDHNIRLETDLTFTKESKCDNFVAHKINLHFPFYPKFTPSFTLTQIIFTQILPILKIYHI